MRVLKIDQKNNFLDLVPDVLDDLWHLEKILEKGDVVSAGTERKIKPKEPGAKPYRQKMTLEVEVEKVSFEKFEAVLRVAGIIVGGRPEDLVELKAHHSLGIEPGSRLKIKKKKLLDFHLQRLKKAEQALKKPKMLVILLDDEQAGFGVLSDFGLEEKAVIRSLKSGKQFAGEASKRYFEEILAKLKELDFKQVILAGPGFTKNELQKFLQEKAPQTSVFVYAANAVGKSGFNEILRKGIGHEAVEEMEIVKESKLVEQLLAEIGRDGLVAYGLKEVKQAVNNGAVKTLLVCDQTFLEQRQELERLMDLTEKMGGAVHIISTEHEAGKRLLNLTGIAALLRFRSK